MFFSFLSSNQLQMLHQSQHQQTPFVLEAALASR